MGTKNQPGQFDCYANALPDEPMFVLLARDTKSPSMVRRWAEAYKQEKECDVKPAPPAYKDGEFIPAMPTRKLTVAEYAKWLEAHDCADAMEKWQKDYRNVALVKQQKIDLNTRPLPMVSSIKD